MMPVCDHHLDARGLRCPEPLMLLHRLLRQAKHGEHIKLMATDPATRNDVAKLCHFLAHELMEQSCLHDEYHCIIRCVKLA